MKKLKDKAFAAGVDREVDLLFTDVVLAGEENGAELARATTANARRFYGLEAGE